MSACDGERPTTRNTTSTPSFLLELPIFASGAAFDGLLARWFGLEAAGWFAVGLWVIACILPIIWRRVHR